MIVKNIDNIKWKKLVEYAVHNCDTVVLSKRYDQWQTRNNKVQAYLSSFVNLSDVKVISSILNIEDFLEEDEIFDMPESVLNKPLLVPKIVVSVEPIESFCKKFYSDLNFKSLLLELGFLKDTDSSNFNIIDSVIRENISWMYYQKKCNEFIEKYKYEKKLEKDIFFNESYMKNTLLYGKAYKTIYGFKIDNSLALELMDSECVYEWKWPKRLDDICFLKNDRVWLLSFSNRNFCDIFCENEREYKYLQSLGIEFCGHFIKKESITMDDLVEL